MKTENETYILITGSSERWKSKSYWDVWRENSSQENLVEQFLSVSSKSVQNDVVGTGTEPKSTSSRTGTF